MLFSDNAVLTRAEQHEKGGPVIRGNVMGDSIFLWVGDKEMGSRVIKEFNHLIKSCK